MMKRNVGIALAVVALAIAGGCKKKPQVTNVPSSPMPQQSAPAPTGPTGSPVISFFTAEPTTIEGGQPSSLRWAVTGATNITIDHNVGQVSPNGRRAVYPTETTTYTLTAVNEIGKQTASVTVTVATPPPPVQPPVVSKQTAQELIAQLQDLHFEYDKSDVRQEDQALLSSDANTLKTIFANFPNIVVTVEGHCDERGSAEYNIGLGDRRASAAKDALISLGVPGDKLKTVSFGKERPLCTDATEDCYLQNRRAHFNAVQ
jgi:peptidoglycan-associated lipoprotein